MRGLALLEASSMGLKEPSWDINPTIIQALQLTGVSYDAKAEVLNLYELVCDSTETASREHFYTGLDDWSKPIYQFIRERMERFGFVNGERTQSPDAMYWKFMFELFSSVTFSSRYLQTDVVRHHASAWERNEAFKKELIDWVARIHQRPNRISMKWPGW